MVWLPGTISVEFRDFHNVIVFPCYSLYFNTLWAKYTEVKYQHNQFFYMNINFEELLSEIENVLQNGGFKLTLSA